MRPLLALAALAAAVVLLRRRKPMPEPDADDSEVVGMPTTQTWEVQVTTGIDWNRFFTTGYVGDPDWRN